MITNRLTKFQASTLVKGEGENIMDINVSNLSFMKTISIKWGIYLVG